jgi:aspartyl-tRNA synthetase
MLRTHTCGELRAAHAGAAVTLAGWVHRRRDHGGLIFVDLRDRHGLTQVVFDPDLDADAFAAAHDLGQEWVIAVDGEVAVRLESNPELDSGEIEVRAVALRVLSASQVPPFEVSRELNIDEGLRMRYRYLDLRRARMARNLRLRHEATTFARNFLDREAFLEVETPILTRATPEGARDYLVPSREHPGRFYALPQSPQQTKQILMVAGADRYYQFARCFRDEDLRADRQPEFTQLDMELSFVDADDVIALNERLMIEMAAAVAPELRFREIPFPRLTFADAMARFGSDKPDLRFGLEIKDLSAAVADSGFRVFSGTVADGGVVKALVVPGVFTRREIDALETIAKQRGAAGLAWLAFEGEAVRGPIAKFLSEEEIAALRLAGQVADRQAEAEDGGAMMLFVAATADVAHNALGRLRSELGAQLGLIPEGELSCCWIVDAPLVEWNEDESRWDAVHHPFTAPRSEDAAGMAEDPAAVRAQAYDLVCNGYEIAGGSIRIHEPEMQLQAFALLGISPEQAEEEFGHMLEAFTYGAPPHGGIAWGWDRTVMLLTGESTIREVIAFPKTLVASDPMTGAPAAVPAANLKVLGIDVLPAEKNKPEA